MPILHTGSLGPVEYTSEDVIDFPEGLPGFDSERHFLLIIRPEVAPVYFLQSLDSPSLLFVTVPVAAIDPAYELKVLPDYYPILGWGESMPDPANLHVLAILCLPEQGPTTGNLLGPVVIDLERRRGVQAIRDDARYGAATRLPPVPPEADTPGKTEADAPRASEAV